MKTYLDELRLKFWKGFLIGYLLGIVVVVVLFRIFV